MQGGSVAVPGANTVWQADGTTLSPGKPVTLHWENGKGLNFTRTIAVTGAFGTDPEGKKRSLTVVTE